MRRAATLVLLLAPVLPVAARDPGPIVRARLDPPGPVTVGEGEHVVVDVLTPTWFLSPPQFPTLDVADALAVFQERGVNLTETIAGTSYSGLQREYLVFPMREGHFTIPSIGVSVVWAIDARPSPPTLLRTVPLSFDATIPAAARGLGAFIPARRLELRQTLEPQPHDLTVGGALRRTITIEAEEAFGMMLPPLPVTAIDGLQAYPDPPQVNDREGERGEARVAHRVESVSYRLKREGSFELPAVEIAWWDLGAKRVRQASLPPVAFSVAPAPARADEIPLPEDTAAVAALEKPHRNDWRRAVVPIASVVAGLALLAWLLPPLGRSMRRTVARLVAARRQRLDSEEAWFGRACRAAGRGDAAVTYHALLGWIERSKPGGVTTLGSFLDETGNVDLTREIERLAAWLYGGGQTTGAWHAHDLVPLLRAARRRALRGHLTPRSALGPLNPTAADPLSPRRSS